MNPIAVLAPLAAALLASCASSFPSPDEADQSLFGKAKARELLAASAAAHGIDPFATGRTITVELDGQWSSLSPKVQPVLVDVGYRQTSTETYDLPEGTTTQIHRGPGGEKTVTRDHRNRTTRVTYDGVPTNDPEVVAAAALVADAYLMFTTSPSYFLHASKTGQALLPDAELDGRPHHRVLTTLSPGFGDSDSDDAVLWIDAATKRATRVHFTLNGLESTRGAHVDVTALGYKEQAGTLFPVRFTEVVRAPLRFTAHDWTTGQIKVR